MQKVLKAQKKLDDESKAYIAVGLETTMTYDDSLAPFYDQFKQKDKFMLEHWEYIIDSLKKNCSKFDYTTLITDLSILLY